MATTAADLREPLARRTLPRAIRRRRRLITIADHSVLIALALMFLLPFVFIVLTGFMTDRQALTSNLWPQPFHLGNFSKVFNQAPLLRYAANTFLYATLS